MVIVLAGLVRTLETRLAECWSRFQLYSRSQKGTDLWSQEMPDWQLAQPPGLWIVKMLRMVG